MKTPIAALGWDEGKNILTVKNHFGDRVTFLGTTIHPAFFDLEDYTDNDIEVLKGLGVTAKKAEGVR